MNSGEHTSRLGRLGAPAALVVSAALFLTALSGIAAIDPGARAAAARAPLTPVPAAHDVSLDPHAQSSSQRRDCPLRHKHVTQQRDVTS
jgi:hypothetical protein